MTEQVANQETINQPQGEAAPEPQQPAPYDFSTSFEGEDLGYIQNKGWKNPEDVVTGYRNLEKLLGSNNKIAMPGEDASNEDWASFYNKLGRPEEVSGYELNAPDGMEIDKSLQDWFANTAHEAGLTVNQAQGLFEKWNELTGSKTQELEKSAQVESEIQMNELKQEWGRAFEEKTQMARNAVRSFGIESNDIDAIENAIGTGKLMKMFASIGEGLGESKFKGGGTASFTMTPGQAQAEIAQLNLDPTFKSQYIGGNKEAVAKMQKLFKLANPQEM